MLDSRFNHHGFLKKSYRIALIYEYLEALIAKLKAKFNLVVMNYPYFGMYDNDFHSRLINFDNKYSTNIYQYFNPLKNIKLYKTFEAVVLESDKNGIICSFDNVYRDNKNSNVSAICETEILMGIRIKSVMKEDATLIDFIQNTILSTINDLNQMYLADLNLDQTLKPGLVIDLVSVEKNAKSFNINRFLKQIIQSQKTVLFHNMNLYKNDLIMINFDEALYKNDSFYNFLVWNEKLKQVLNVFEIYFNAVSIDKMNLKQVSNNELNVVRYDGDFLIVKINFSKLMLFLLQANHICEVTFSPWDQDEIDAFIKEGYDYL